MRSYPVAATNCGRAIWAIVQAERRKATACQTPAALMRTPIVATTSFREHSKVLGMFTSRVFDIATAG